MKALIVYCSRTGNTEKVVQNIAAHLDVEIAPADGITAKELAGRPVVGLASGIYWVRHDRALFAAVDMIPKQTKVFLVSTSGFNSRIMAYIYSFLVKRRIRRAGLHLMGQWHCPGHDRSKDILFRFLKLSKGRPNEIDLADAVCFVREMVGKNRL